MRGAALVAHSIVARAQSQTEIGSSATKKGTQNWDQATPSMAPPQKKGTQNWEQATLSMTLGVLTEPPVMFHGPQAL